MPDMISTTFQQNHIRLIYVIPHGIRKTRIVPTSAVGFVVIDSVYYSLPVIVILSCCHPFPSVVVYAVAYASCLFVYTCTSMYIKDLPKEQVVTLSICNFAWF